ncbi:cyclin-T1-3-like [Ananas comosus]|uniref:Cyclin-T1-3-like n=1 Tax=Ananas comosus TaxID=4615 RepID=A0A6P5F7W1_ANACO|nr:cyclin-T1-3-like [Ananas comosus]XP_020091697.1 cyclin-T1-3-like [Ananas comosus]
MVESSSYRSSIDRHEEESCPGSSWYFSRKEIEENSPSRRDGIDPKKETYLRKSYCTFLQDLGMRLKVPQVTIATAIVFCHRFFLRQSHAKNDRRTIATVCMFLAGKVEETPRPLKDVILVSYEIIHKKDPDAVQRIKQREVYEQQKELILLGERVVLATLGFDLNVHHPYKPLVEAIKKFKVAQHALAQVAWNFVNDGLRTSLCLQFKSHHIAAGAIFLAAKFLKVKLPSDGEKVWWQEFDVTPRQLEEVSNQMLELYEQNRAAPPPPHANETEGSSASGPSHQPSARVPGAASEEVPPPNGGHSQVTTKPPTMHHSIPISSSAQPLHHDQPYPDYYKQNESHRILQKDSNDRESIKTKTSFSEGKTEAGIVEEPEARAFTGADEAKEKPSAFDSMKKIDKDKVKAALEKRKKLKGDVARKVDPVDEDDLIERELEHGVELAVEDERIKQERRQKPYHITENGNLGVERALEGAEEGEVSMDGRDYCSPEPSSQKRKATTSPTSKHFGGKDGYDGQHYHGPFSKRREGLDDARIASRFERGEKEHKRFRQENQV